MWPLAVAGLGLIYFKIGFLEMLGHPFRKHFCIALCSAEILGLHNDLCANLTLIGIEMEWAKTAMCLTVSSWVGLVVCGAVLRLGLRGIVHKLVVGSLNPFSIVLSLYIMSQ